MIEFEKVEINSERWFNLTPLLNEKFRPIKNYEGLYEVSNYGRVKRLLFINNNIKKSKEKVLSCLKCSNNKKCYIAFVLSKNGKEKRYYTHRLVAQAFIPNPDNLPQINHKDGNKQNNRVDNLEWCDGFYNQQHAVKTGLREIKTGKDCKNIKPILQYDKNMNLITKWEYIKQVSDILNIPAPNICNCCKGKIKSAGGYIWKYEEEK